MANGIVNEHIISNKSIIATLSERSKYCGGHSKLCVRVQWCRSGRKIITTYEHCVVCRCIIFDTTTLNSLWINAINFEFLTTVCPICVIPKFTLYPARDFVNPPFRLIALNCVCIFGFQIKNKFIPKNI